MSIRGLIVSLCRSGTSTPVWYSLDKNGYCLFHLHTAFHHWDIHQFRYRTIGSGVRAVFAADRARTDELFSLLCRRELRVHHRSPTLIKSFRPIQFIDILGAVEIFAARPIEHIKVTV